MDRMEAYAARHGLDWDADDRMLSTDAGDAHVAAFQVADFWCLVVSRDRERLAVTSATTRDLPDRMRRLAQKWNTDGGATP